MAKFSPPRGMRDFYPEDMKLRNHIFDAWRLASTASGFEQYDACVVESLELLQRKAGEEIVNQIYAFEDKSGRQLALRPEMPPTLARMIVARQGALQFPVKWFTIAQCFRYERMTRGRKREHYQWNLDIIDENSVSAEAEIIYTAINALRLMNIPDNAYRVRISNRTLLSELLSSLGIAQEFHPAIFMALDKKGKLPREEIEKLMLAENLDAEACSAAFDLMDITSLEDAAEIAGDDSPAVASLRKLFELLNDYGVAEQAVFDISVIRGLAYYTGIVFEAFDTKGEFRAIFGGGRYDGLLSAIGGKPASAVGMGFGDVVIGEIIEELKIEATSQNNLIAIGYMTDDERTMATRLASKLRAEGKSVTLQTRPSRAKAFFSFASARAAKAVYIGPDDRNSGKAFIKDLNTREEEMITLT
ncbi:MAG: histidine--tRNA ligase [Lentisphaerae bacterium]|nr:histidine--tRNA ligase [Lentisphaerota bacterium]